MWGIKLKIKDKENAMGVTWGEGSTEVVNHKGANYMVANDDSTLGGGHTMQYTDQVS